MAKDPVCVMFVEEKPESIQYNKDGRGNNDAVADAFLVRLRLSLLLASSILLVSFVLVTTTATTSIAQEENDTAMVSSFPLKFSSLPIVDEVVINKHRRDSNKRDTHNRNLHR